MSDPCRDAFEKWRDNTPTDEERDFAQLYGGEINEFDRDNGQFDLAMGWVGGWQARGEADRWIPVTERLPEDKNYKYLVWACEDCYSAKWTGKEFVPVYGNLITQCDWSETLPVGGRYHNITMGSFDVEPTHWKPLPEPPEDA